MTVGRFAPTPSGRLHLGNVFCALLAYLDAKSKGGENVLRIEDLDNARCSFGDNAEILKDDLRWLGLRYDRGGEPESYQSRRFPIYETYFRRLYDENRLYPCYCSRAELHAATAPHSSDGNPIYDGKCRRLFDSGAKMPTDRPPAYRLRVPDENLTFTDKIQGTVSENLALECGDFVLRRSDGIYAYQLAVVVDDALSGVTEVVRGRDLLSSTARQIYLYRLLGFREPEYYHIPLLTLSGGHRLSKRDGDMDIGAFRKYASPEDLLGLLAYHAGQIDRKEAISLETLVSLYDVRRIPKEDVVLDTDYVSRILQKR